MLKHRRLLQNDNEALREQNSNLEALVRAAQARVIELSSSLQKEYINVMPSMTVCNDLVETSKCQKCQNVEMSFAKAGAVRLDSPGRCVDDNGLIAVGQNNNAISIWGARQPSANISNSVKQSKSQTSSGALYRFSMDKSALDDDDTNPIYRAANPFLGHRGVVTSVKWMDESTLSSTSLDSTIKIWDIHTGKYHSISLELPAIAHTITDGTLVVASCSRSVMFSDPKEPMASTIESQDIITSVASTKLGLLVGTTTGDIKMIDTRMWRPFQSIKISPVGLPISKITAGRDITVTCFDGVVRTLGQQLPLFVDRELERASVMGGVIGSCCVSLSSRDNFVVCGSTNGRATIWSKSGVPQVLAHEDGIVHDCTPLSAFVGAFVTVDDSPHMTMWACSFNKPCK